MSSSRGAESRYASVYLEGSHATGAVGAAGVEWDVAVTSIGATAEAAGGLHILTEADAGYKTAVIRGMMWPARGDGRAAAAAAAVPCTVGVLKAA